MEVHLVKRTVQNYFRVMNLCGKMFATWFKSDAQVNRLRLASTEPSSWCRRALERKLLKISSIFAELKQYLQIVIFIELNRPCKGPYFGKKIRSNSAFVPVMWIQIDCVRIQINKTTKLIITSLFSNNLYQNLKENKFF